MQDLYGFCNWNEYSLNLLTSTNWRASLVPAAAVIPAPIAYIKVVAVKKLVVESRSPFFFGNADGRKPRASKGVDGAVYLRQGSHLSFSKVASALHWVGGLFHIRDIYFEKIRVFKAGSFA